MLKLKLGLSTLVLFLGAVGACGEDAVVGEQTDAGRDDGDGSVDGDGSGDGDGNADGDRDGDVDLSCEGANPQGCSDANPCESGFVCESPDNGECVPSACGCDASTGTWACTSDCSGGVCVPEGEFMACPGLDTTQCDREDRCEEGSVCTNLGVGQCLPSPSPCYCEDVATGKWVCPPNCEGTVCVPEEQSACAGLNNPQGCSDSRPCPGFKRCVPSLEPVCIPSFCMCNPEGGWDCSDDCDGGVCEN